MTIYSLNGEYPMELPHRIKLSDGSTRTDKTTFTAEEISDAGYVAVEDKPDANTSQVVEWIDGAWSIRSANTHEIDNEWYNIKTQCVTLLEASDYKVLKAYEANTAVDPAYITYRQELRDLYNNVANTDPWSVVYPSEPDSNDDA